MARVKGSSLGISHKISIEICNAIRKKNLKDAKAFLKRVLAFKEAVPYKRFKESRGHKPGMAAGGYPEKASEEILALLESVEANAQFKGLNTAHLIIIHINANKAGMVRRLGRHRGRKTKRTSIEIVVEERKDAVKEKKQLVKKEKTIKND